ncbi:unnamed protein product, partial [Timema podura]|nr:unnamed protein product [Timema podura]
MPQHSLETTNSKLEAGTIPDTFIGIVSDPSSTNHHTLPGEEGSTKGSSNVSDPSSTDHNTLPGEEEEVVKHLYLVQAQQSGTTDLYELFLVITDSHVKERDAQSGHTLKRWDISSLLSCTITINHPPTVHLTFDTVRSDGKERIYIMEHADCQVAA